MERETILLREKYSNFSNFLMSQSVVIIIVLRQYPILRHTIIVFVNALDIIAREN
jgi:hypothetical protein